MKMGLKLPINTYEESSSSVFFKYAFVSETTSPKRNLLYRNAEFLIKTWSWRGAWEKVVLVFPSGSSSSDTLRGSHGSDSRAQFEKCRTYYFFKYFLSSFKLT